MGQFSRGLFDDLTLYVRQAAWLNAVPKRPKSATPDDSPRLTRLERMRRDKDDEDFEPDMPVVETVGHLIRHLWEIGPAMPGGMGPAPITHQEISAWQEMAGVDLRPWEARWLRSLSCIYVCEVHKAEAPEYPAPWQGEEFVQESRSAAAMAMRSALRAMAQE